MNEDMGDMIIHIQNCCFPHKNAKIMGHSLDIKKTQQWLKLTADTLYLKIQMLR
jgi:hypothetical protein